MKHLEDEFKQVLQVSGQTTATDRQITELRKIFYCGATAALHRMDNNVAATTLWDEIRAFREEMRIKQAN